MSETSEEITAGPREPRALPVSLTQVAGALALGAASWQLTEIESSGDLRSAVTVQLVLVALAGLVALTGRLPHASPLLVGIAWPVALLYWAVLPIVVQYGDYASAKFWALMALMTAAIALAGRDTGRPALARIYERPISAVAAALGLAFAGSQYFVFRDFRLGPGEALPEVMSVVITLLVAGPLVWGLGLRQPARRWLLLSWVACQGISWFELVRNVGDFPGDGRWLLLLCIPTALLAIVCALLPDTEEATADDPS